MSRNVKSSCFAAPKIPSHNELEESYCSADAWGDEATVKITLAFVEVVTYEINLVTSDCKIKTMDYKDRQAPQTLSYEETSDDEDEPCSWAAGAVDSRIRKTLRTIDLCK